MTSFSAGNHFVAIMAEYGNLHIVFSEDYNSLRMKSVFSKAVWLKCSFIAVNCEKWMYVFSAGSARASGPPGIHRAPRLTRIPRTAGPQRGQGWKGCSWDHRIKRRCGTENLMFLLILWKAAGVLSFIKLICLLYREQEVFLDSLVPMEFL